MRGYSGHTMMFLLSVIVSSLLLMTDGRVFQRVHQSLIEPVRIDIGDSSVQSIDIGRVRRSASGSDQGKLVVNITKLEDRGHNEAIVHWSGQKSQMIFLLTRARNKTGSVTTSSLYRSVDFGATFSPVKIGDDKTVIQHFYVCPTNKDKLIFYDCGGRRLYVTSDEGDSFVERFLPPRPSTLDQVLFHPKVEDWLLVYSDVDRKLYFSGDLCQTWDLVYEMVNPRFSWAVPEVDGDKSIIHLEVEDSATGKFLYRAVKKPYPSLAYSQIDFELGYIAVGSLVLQKEYIFVQKAGESSAADEGPLYVSYNRGQFKRAHFPQQALHSDYMILDAVDGQVFIAANHKAGAISLYISDVTGRFYVKSLDRVVAINQADIFQVDLHEVKGMRGTYIVNQYASNQPKTLISFDQGGKWREIPSPEKYENGTATGCTLPNCSLYIHLSMDSYMYGIPTPLSDENAPGLILAQGVIGRDRKTRFVMSTDGGLTWIVAMTGIYHKTILDQGGAIVAVEFNSSTRLVREIKYSCTEGDKWEAYPFEGNRMKVDGLLNEPGITSLVSSLYGHTTESKDDTASWIIAKLDFSLILNKPCEPKDYTFWTPTDGVAQHGCLLGEKKVFERRRLNVECFNGIDYERAINVTTCPCIREDFECDYGYELSASDGDTCIPAKWFNTTIPIEDCQVGERYLKSLGYRKVAADQCIDSDESSRRRYEPVNTTCPTLKPEGLSVLVLGRDILRSKTNVTFRAILDKGNQTATQYLWSFGDGTTFNISGIYDGIAVHSYHNYGFYDVTVTARSSAGSETDSLKIWIQDGLAGLHVSVAHAALVSRVTTIRALPYFTSLSSSSHQADLRAADDVHYLWIFGDEPDRQKNVGLLTWNSSVEHTYTKTGNYSLWVEAFNGVGSAFQNIVIPVYGTGTIVQLNLRGIVTSSVGLGSAMTAFIDVLAETLKRVLIYELNIDSSRLDVEIDEGLASIAYVTVLPTQQSMSDDPNIKEIVNLLLLRGQDKDLHFVLPHEAFGTTGNITIVRAVVVPDDYNEGGTSGHLMGFLIAVPSIVLVCLATICIAVYYRKKLRSLNHYRVLHSRYRNGSGGGPDSLLSDETDDDDEPLIDPTNNDITQRLALSEDEDLQEAEIILSGARAGRNPATLQINC